MKNPETGIEGWHCELWFKKSKAHEFSTDGIREGRKKYEKHLLQPYRAGEFSKEYRDAYPEVSRKMVKSGSITKEQHDSAKDVWREENK